MNKETPKPQNPDCTGRAGGDVRFSASSLKENQCHPERSLQIRCGAAATINAGSESKDLHFSIGFTTTSPHKQSVILSEARKARGRKPALSKAEGNPRDPSSATAPSIFHRAPNMLRRSTTEKAPGLNPAKTSRDRSGLQARNQRTTRGPRMLPAYQQPPGEDICDKPQHGSARTLRTCRRVAHPHSPKIHIQRIHP